MKKVLILDDRLLASGDLSKCLTELGFAVVRDGASGDDVAERVDRASADIVLMGGSVFTGGATAEDIFSVAPKPIVLFQEANGRNQEETGSGGGYVLIPFAAPEVAAALELAAAGLADLSSLKKENDELKKTL